MEHAVVDQGAERRHWLRLAASLAVGALAIGLVEQRAGAAGDGAGTGKTPGAAGADAANLRSIAVLDFELIDDHENPLTKDAQQIRLRNSTVQLRRELAEQRLYRVVDAAPYAGVQRDLQAQHEYLYRCDDCADQIGRQAGADLVMGAWVQKVSELILNLNVEIYDVGAKKVIFMKSVDLRGNDDRSWQRALHYLVRDMAEKRAADPGYAR